MKLRIAGESREFADDVAPTWTEEPLSIEDPAT